MNMSSTRIDGHVLNAIWNVSFTPTSSVSTVTSVSGGKTPQYATSLVADNGRTCVDYDSSSSTCSEWCDSGLGCGPNKGGGCGCGTENFFGALPLTTYTVRASCNVRGELMKRWRSLMVFAVFRVLAVPRRVFRPHLRTGRLRAD